MSGPYKPFGTEREARAAAHAVIAPEGGRSILTTAQNRQLIRFALEAAGVTTGAYDDRIADWLSQYEDAICAVIAGWVTRAAASAAGDQAAAQLAEIRRVLDAFDWEHGDRQYALERVDDIVRGVE